MGVMMLAAEYGVALNVRADGPDAKEAVDALTTLISNRFGEK
jgi:phosphocarrier protein